MGVGKYGLTLYCCAGSSRQATHPSSHGRSSLDARPISIMAPSTTYVLSTVSWPARMLTSLCSVQSSRRYGKYHQPMTARPKTHSLIAQDIEVPETLLKKRKQNEKAREEKFAAISAARKVRYSPVP